MGSRIYWTPFKRVYLEDQSVSLKNIFLEKRIKRLDYSDIDWLRGLGDSGVDGADELIEIIADIGAVLITITD